MSKKPAVKRPLLWLIFALAFGIGLGEPPAPKK